MQAGKILRSFNAKDGQNVILRTLRREDLDDLLELINSLVEEKADSYVTEKFTREAETEWLLEALVHLERDGQLFLAAEVDEKVVALSDFQVKEGGPEQRAAVFGIIVRNRYRDLDWN